MRHCFIEFMQQIDSPMRMGDLLTLLDSASPYFLFVKDKNSTYTYANENYLQLMGLNKLSQLQGLTDYDLYKNHKEASLYQDLDQYTLETAKTLPVKETIYPKNNEPIIKTMEGKLYPLFLNSERANFVLGVVTSECKLLKLDFNTLFSLTQNELSDLLIKSRYKLNIEHDTVVLSKMEIRTLIQLLKGAHAGQIATALEIKQTTVESYLSNIKNKLAVSSKNELIECVIYHKLLEQILL